MNPMNRILFCLLLPLVLVSLVSCEDKPVIPDQNISIEKIRNDLVNRKIDGLTEGDFQISEPGLVERLEINYETDKAKASIAIKAIDLQAKAGVEGTLSLGYQYNSDNWKLMTITAVSIEQIDKAYAQRLSELVEFPLHFAANFGDIEQVKNELEKGTPVDSPETKKLSSALMFASERGFIEIVKLLVSHGADINYQNKFGFSPLHASAYGDHIAVAKLLTENGAEVDAKDDKGRTPLYFAAERNALQVAELLIEKGAGINTLSDNNWPPLYAAANSNALDVAKYLIDSGAQVNIATEEGRHSPLLGASYHNNVEMVKLLLAAGADTSAKLSKSHLRYGNQTALDLAERQGNDEVVELLKKKADPQKN